MAIGRHQMVDVETWLFHKILMSSGVLSQLGFTGTFFARMVSNLDSSLHIVKQQPKKKDELNEK